MPRKSWGLVVGMSAVLVAVPGASAATLTVTKTADTADGACNADCSLREAIIATNATDASDVITLPAGTYALSIAGRDEDDAATGDLDVAGPASIFGRTLEIIGAGARTTTVVGDGTDRVLDVRENIAATISGVTVTGGAGVGDGAGIRVIPHGNLTLRDAAVVGNSASAPGDVSRRGGGLYLASGGASRLERVLVANNSTISKPGDTNAPQGGGIYITFQALLTNVTIAGNTADSRSSAIPFGDDGAQGAGLFTENAAGMTNVTVASNRLLGAPGTPLAGAGVFSTNQTLVAQVVIAGNTANGDAAAGQCSGGVQPNGRPNLSTTAAACNFTSHDDVEADPLLGPLRDNGGATDTMDLAPGSPARDRLAFVYCPDVDQRGITRTGRGSACDFGALEAAGPAAPPATPPPPPVTPPPPPATRVTPQAKPEPKPIPAAKAFKLPAAKRCVSRRNFRIRIRKLPGITWVRARVFVNGKRVKTVRRARITAPVDLRGLPKGRYVVKIVAKTSDGRTVTGKRRYRTCARKRRARRAPKL